MTQPFSLTPPSLPPPRTRRQIGGRTAQRSGSNFQKVIAQSAGLQKSVVSLEELPSFGARYVFDPKLRKRKLITEKICCDYVGALVGFSGFFADAKSCGEAEKAFNVKLNIMSEDKIHQYRFLMRMKKAEMVAGYLIECKHLGEYLWLDVGHIVDDGPIPFTRDGVLCRQFVSLGTTSLMVKFDLLRGAYE